MRRLDHISEIISGHPFRNKISNEKSGETLVVQMKDLDGPRITWNSVFKCTPKRVKEARYLKKGDIVFVARGKHNTATLIKDLHLSAICSPHFFIIRTSEQMGCIPGFLHWYLNQQATQQYFERNSQGSNVQSLSRQILEATPIPDVSIEKQKTLAALAKATYQHQSALQAQIDNDQLLMEGIAQSLLPTTKA